MKKDCTYSTWISLFCGFSRSVKKLSDKSKWFLVVQTSPTSTTRTDSLPVWSVCAACAVKILTHRETARSNGTASGSSESQSPVKYDNCIHRYRRYGLGHAQTEKCIEILLTIRIYLVCKQGLIFFVRERVAPPGRTSALVFVCE